MSIFNSRDDRAAARAPRRISSVGGGGHIALFPILTALNPGTIAATTLTNATVLTDTNIGRIYMAVVSNGGSATDAQIIAGAGGNIIAGAAASAAIVAGVTQTIASITGLTTATTYQLLALQVVGNGVSGAHSLQYSTTFTTT